MDVEGLARWLAGWDGAALTVLLERRPDVIVGRPPGGILHLAERLCHPDSIAAALRGLAVPAVQVLEALQALGERRTRQELLALLERGARDHEAAVDAILAELTAAALVWPDGDRLAVPAGLGDVFPSPLGLGPTARELWSPQYAEAIGRALRAFGERPAGRKAEQLEALLERLADPAGIRRVVANAPPEIAEALHRMAWNATDDEDDEDYLDVRFDPEEYRRQRDAERWAVDHGLIPGGSWGPVGPMPSEVSLALREPAFRAPFSPRPPEIATRPVNAEAVESAAAAAITVLAGHALALLDRLARSPVPRLAGGGIGVRELGRLTKEQGLDEAEARLLLDVAAAGGLLAPTDDAVTVTEVFARWRAAEPATQVAGLLVAWWAFPGTPADGRDENGKALPAIRRREQCAGCQAARVVLLGVAGTLPEGRATDRAGLTATARWTRPMVHVLPQDAAEPLATVWREAELLGVLAAGALSPLGASLLAEDTDTLLEHLRRLLPRATDSASFGSDLTALVAGTPSARITTLLDGCADRESSGGAVTWRFSPASVRRALDEGADAEGLVERLAAVTDRELPQPLTFLVRDVGRRHGRLRLLPAASVIRSDDEALLAEVAADRRLASLGLQRLAPTVLGCAVPLEQALARLREVGYFPVDDRPAEPPRPQPVAVTSGRGAPRPPARPAPSPIAPEALANALLDGSGLPAVRSEVADELARAARHLSAAELDWLTAAIEDGGRVRIEYVSASGAATRRVVDDLDLDGGMLYAWCELRQDDRVFNPSRILSVAPVD